MHQAAVWYTYEASHTAGAYAGASPVAKAAISLGEQWYAVGSSHRSILLRSAALMNELHLSTQLSNATQPLQRSIQCRIDECHRGECAWVSEWEGVGTIECGDQNRSRAQVGRYCGLEQLVKMHELLAFALSTAACCIGSLQ